jgi:glycosyltransferase involved in cell wall biosynthesis
MLCMPGTIPHISIVVPVYNEEDTISDCLDAIFRQTVAADEVVVVDNNSTDGTATLLDGYREGSCCFTNRDRAPAMPAILV